MNEFLGVVCFSPLIGALFLAVIAVDRLKQDGQPNSTDACETPGCADSHLHVLAERLHGRDGS
jgi:hypothetical protein